MFISPSTRKPSPPSCLTPQLTTQLTKTYKDEDFHVRKLTDPKNCISAEDYIYVAHRNSQERIKVYGQLWRGVSEFNVGETEKTAGGQGEAVKEDYLIIELTKQAEQKTLALRNVPVEYYEALLPMLRIE